VVFLAYAASFLMDTRVFAPVTDNAEWVARVIDGGKKVEAKIEWITGGTRDKPFRGVVIDVDTTPGYQGTEKAETGGFWKSLFGRGR